MNIEQESERLDQERLNVLFFTTWYPSDQDRSAGIFVREHAKAVQLYDNVAVIHSIGRNRMVKSLWELQQIQDEELTEGIPTYVFRHRYSPIPRTTQLIRFYSVVKAFQALRKEGFQPDVIHAHIHEQALPAVFLGKLFRIPVVITEQHSAFPRRLLSKMNRLEANISFRLADLVLPVSKALQKGIEGYGIHVDYELVPNVVDTTQFKPNPTGKQLDACKKLLCVANMPKSHVKGIPYLIEALVQLKEQRTDFHLDLIGDGPERANYAQQVQAAGLGDHFTFHGYKPKADIVKAMQAADVFVLASVWDNMPCVIVEAMASGLPIVATNIGGIPEMVTETTGILAEPADATSLCISINRILEQLPSFDQAAIAAEAERRFSQHAVGKQFDQIYRRFVKRRKS